MNRIFCVHMKFCCTAWSGFLNCPGTGTSLSCILFKKIGSAASIWLSFFNLIRLTPKAIVVRHDASIIIHSKFLSRVIIIGNVVPTLIILFCAGYTLCQ